VGDDRDSPKARVRRALDARRNALASGDVARASRAICDRVASLPAFRHAAVVVLYAARLGEVDPCGLETADAGGSRKTFFYPRVEGDRLTFRQATFERLAPGRYGIPEPSADAPALRADVENAVAMVPGLGFDRAGARLGSGKGYYDRSLPAFGSLRRIGLAMDAMVVDALPTDPWDVPMHVVVTERDLLLPAVVGGPSAGDLQWR
jgi:5-formyltetrahydrofolate cyclo-ligase